MHNKQASWPPFPEKCAVAPLCIFTVAALAERRGKEESIREGLDWGEEMFGDRNRTLIWKNCIHTETGGRKGHAQTAGKNQKNLSGLIRVIFEIYNSNIW